MTLIEPSQENPKTKIMSALSSKPKKSVLSRKLFGEEWASLESTDENSEFHIEKIRDHLKLMLTSNRLLVLAGSGTSIGATADKTGGPSMWELWESISKIKNFKEVKALIKFSIEGDIEGFLSHCHNAEPFIPEAKVEMVQKLVIEAEGLIFKACSEFLKNEPNLPNHEKFLSRLIRRRNKAPRPVIFTTNYDRCFELAASKLSLTVIDGFTYSQPRFFDPNLFGYDFIRRSNHATESNELLDGVFHLLKVHGSVDWQLDSSQITQRLEPDPTKRCLIYPASTKYQKSYVQPYLEMMARFLTSLREPQTSLLVVGFGFNDDHLSAPIFSALQSNPSLNVVAISPSIEAQFKENKVNLSWKKLKEEALDPQSRVTLLNCDFGQLVNLIPDLKALSPDQRLAASIRGVAKNP